MTELSPEQTGTLTAKEQALFELLTRNRGRLFTRMEILERVWGLDFGGDERIVDAYVKRIRRKISEDAIETVRGAGYRRPSVPDQRQALPHFQHLSSDARTILNLGRRVLHVSTVRGVLLEVEAVLGATLGICGVALLQPGNEAGVTWEVQSACGDDELNWTGLPALHTNLPSYRADFGASRRPFALLPLAGPEQTWGTLAIAGKSGLSWDEAVYAQLEAVAALVNPALRLAMEINLRQLAERELRDLNARLEYGVQQRTSHLLQAKQQAELLNLFSREAEKARSVPELLAVSLPVLARLAGTQACAVWRPGMSTALASFRVDGTFCPSPDRPHRETGKDTRRALHAAPPVSSAHLLVDAEWDGEQIIVQAFNPSGSAVVKGEVSSLLVTAAQSLTLMLSRHQHIAALERTALTDDTTGLGNRQAFLSDLTGEVAFSARHQTTFVLCLIEVANIRFLNATVGYAGGNDAIRQLARTLGQLGRTEDRVYRLNGATFAVLMRLPPESQAGQAELALAGWRERLTWALQTLRGQLPFPVEFLSSEVRCPQQARTSSELLRLALERLHPLEKTLEFKTLNAAQSTHG